MNPYLTAGFNDGVFGESGVYRLDLKVLISIYGVTVRCPHHKKFSRRMQLIANVGSIDSTFFQRSATLFS